MNTDEMRLKANGKRYRAIENARELLLPLQYGSDGPERHGLTLFGKELADTNAPNRFPVPFRPSVRCAEPGHHGLDILSRCIQRIL
jgi:hypothetical protein